MADGLSNDVYNEEGIQCLIQSADVLESVAYCLLNDVYNKEHILSMIESAAVLISKADRLSNDDNIKQDFLKSAAFFRSMADYLSNGVNMKDHIDSQRMHGLRLLTIVYLLEDTADFLSNNVLFEVNIYSHPSFFIRLIKVAYLLISMEVADFGQFHSYTMSDCLPKDLIIDILSRLPVKSLMKFRSVSKAWYSLISSPHFTATHRNRSLSNSQHPHSLFVSYSDYKPPSCSEVRHTLLLSRNQEIEQTGNFSADRPNCIELPDIHQNMKLNFLDLVGSSDGILCLANRTFNNKHGLCVLWNPSIQKVEFLPKPVIEVHSSLNHSVGFGSDPSNKDYKLVRLVYRPPNTDAPLVEIYTRQTGIWRPITAPSTPYLMENWSSSVFVNGAVHWAAKTPGRLGGFHNVIMRFNMKDEAFGEMGLPQSLVGLDDLTVSVALHDGLLALVRCNQFGNERSLAVWVMKEYAVVESWTKVFDVPTTEFDINRVIGFTKSGKVLVDRAGRLSSLGPSSERRVDLPIGGAENISSDYIYLDTYAESLAMQNVAMQNVAMQNVAMQNVAMQNVAMQNVAMQNVAGRVSGQHWNSWGCRERLFLAYAHRIDEDKLNIRGAVE